MTLRERLLAELAKDQGSAYLATPGWYGFADEAALISDDDALERYVREAITDRLKLAERYRNDAEDQEQEAAVLATALARVIQTRSHR